MVPHYYKMGKMRQAAKKSEKQTASIVALDNFIRHLAFQSGEKTVPNFCKF